MKLLGQMVTLCLTSRETAKLFSKAVATSPPSSVRELQFLHHPHQRLFTFSFSHPVDMKWNLTVILSCISLMTDHVEHLLCIYLSKAQQLSLQHGTNTNNPSSMKVVLKTPEEYWNKAPNIGPGSQQCLNEGELYQAAMGRGGRFSEPREVNRSKDRIKAGVRSTGLTMAWLNLDSISPSSQSKASPLSRNSSAIRREHSVDRRWILKSKVAFSWACRLRGSSPFTITSFLLNSLTPGGQARDKELVDWDLPAETGLAAPQQLLTLYHLDGVQVGGKARVDVEDLLSIPDHAQQVAGEDNLGQEGREAGPRVRASCAGPTPL